MFEFGVNGVYSVLANNDTPAGANPFNWVLGSGDVFSLRIRSTDGLFGSLSVSVTNWVPAPGALALLGVAGLAGTRRRRG